MKIYEAHKAKLKLTNFILSILTEVCNKTDTEILENCSRSSKRALNVNENSLVAQVSVPLSTFIRVNITIVVTTILHRTLS